MKTLYSIVLVLCTLTTAVSQQSAVTVKKDKNGKTVSYTTVNYADIIDLAKFNLKLLDKGQGISINYNISYDGIRIDYLKPTEQFFPVKTLNKTQVLLETLDINKLSDLYQSKALPGYVTPTYLKTYQTAPSNIEGLIVAIDPGHFANDIRTAIQEQKYVKMKGELFGQKKDIAFYEAELNDLTAILVESKLIALGAKPFRTKAAGYSSLGKSFKDWYRDDFRRDLEISYNKKEISNTDVKDLTTHQKDSSYVLDKFYKFKDFRNRVDIINSREPDLTICIHYNAKEGGKRDANGYLNPVQENYSMAFVPGAFLGNELNRPSEKVDFLRLLLSPDMDKSMRLAHLILTQQRITTGIAPVEKDSIKLDDRYCTLSPYEGVYLRNLAMTRMVRGPIVYLEAMLQDNKEAAQQLSVKDYEFDHPEYGHMKAPKICEQVAQGIVNGILAWLEENKSYSLAVGNKEVDGKRSVDNKN